MDTATKQKIPAVVGTPFGGGFVAGKVNIAGAIFALIVASKLEGEHAESQWHTKTERVSWAESFFDGLANTRAMAEAGSPLAQWAQGLRIGGFDDWYLPSRDELEIVYRNLKPGLEENWVHRNGENMSAVPPTWPYTQTDPKQTDAPAFRADGAEAFATEWYWTSTQHASHASYAWVQDFFDGYQADDHKVNGYRARAVRTVAI